MSDFQQLERRRRFYYKFKRIVRLVFSFYCIGGGKNVLSKCFPYFWILIGVIMTAKAFYFGVILHSDDVNALSLGLGVSLAVGAICWKVKTLNNKVHLLYSVFAMSATFKNRNSLPYSLKKKKKLCVCRDTL